MRLIVAGSRTITDREMVFEKLDQITELYEKNHPEGIEVVTGMAKGPDTFGLLWARLHSLAVRKFPADWKKGRRAGYLRNEQMADYATHLIAFWDGKSRGTQHMIDLARKKGLTVRIVRTDKEG